MTMNIAVVKVVIIKNTMNTIITVINIDNKNVNNRGIAILKNRLEYDSRRFFKNLLKKPGYF